MSRTVHKPPRLSSVQKGSSPTRWSKFVGIRCPSCKRVQPPNLIAKTNPSKGYNKFDFHICGGCGNWLYLKGGIGRYIRFFLLVMPSVVIISLGMGGLVSQVEVLSTYRPARGGDEPNFLGFLILCATMFLAISWFSRFETVGLVVPPATEEKQAQSTNVSFPDHENA